MPPITDDTALPGPFAEAAQRITAIEERLLQVENLLDIVNPFNDQLENISTTLAVVLSLLAQEGDFEKTPVPLPAGEGGDTAELRIITHIRRGVDQGSRLITDISWHDMWVARLFATAMLRTLSKSSLIADGSRCWCEVWRPDESGDIVDSAYLRPGTGAVEWESDLLDSGNGL